MLVVGHRRAAERGSEQVRLVVVRSFDSAETAFDGRNAVRWGHEVGVDAAKVDVVRVDWALGRDDAVFDVHAIVHWRFTRVGEIDAHVGKRLR